MRIKLDIPLTLDEIRKAIGADEYGGTIENIRIDTLCTDTRECQRGDLFIALVGENDSGDKYVADALKIGCFVLSSLNTNGTLRVKDTADALLKIAQLYKSKLPSLRTVAVT